MNVFELQMQRMSQVHIRRVFEAGALLLLVGLCAWAAPTVAAASQTIADEVAALRLALEQAQTSLNEVQRESLDEALQFQTRESDLLLQLQRERLRREVLDAAARLHGQTETQTEEARRAVRPVLLKHLDRLRVTIDQTLPFRRSERLAAVQVLRDDIELDRVPTAEAASRLVGLLEAELRLFEQVGRATQPMDLGSGEQLVDVVHFGLGALWVLPSDGRVGILTADRSDNIRWVPPQTARAMRAWTLETTSQRAAGFVPWFEGSGP